MEKIKNKVLARVKQTLWQPMRGLKENPLGNIRLTM